MADPVSNTFAIAVQGAGGAGAGETVISGSAITLPAAGPWTIHHIWCQVVAATNTVAEQLGGFIRMNAVQGDLDPNPAPTQCPTPVVGSHLGATVDVSMCPLDLIPTRYVGPGIAQIELIYNQPIAMAVAPQLAAGIIFSRAGIIPEAKPRIFVGQVDTTVTSAASTSIGTITLAEKATRITGICAQELIGIVTLSSDDIKLQPAQYPCSAAFSAGIGALINNSTYATPVWIPVDIPLEASRGARIACSLDLNTAVTNGAYISVALAYEM